MEMAKPEDIVEQIYDNLNRLEYVLDGDHAEVKLATLAKLREIYLRAKQQNNERLYLQAFRLYHRLLSSTDAAMEETEFETYADQLAQHVSNLTLRTLKETGWTKDKTADEIAEFIIWHTEILTMDFEQRFPLGP
ncbi:MAG: hypothetical protein GX316_08270 [Firmicutes bacterium]|nr:hypothetical protein [Bacillota bacterium]